MPAPPHSTSSGLRYTSQRISSGNRSKHHHHQQQLSHQFNLDKLPKLPNLYSEQAIRQNHAKLEKCTTRVCALSGIVAGILALNGLAGFAFYAITSLAFCMLLYVKFVTNKAQSERCFANDWHMITSGHINGICTYVLMWTFTYGIVHVY